MGATDATADHGGSTGAKAMLTDLEFIRYSRQLMLPDFGEPAQLKLKQSKVLLIGCGGLGHAASQYLVSSGIGQLTLVDGDKVELSNLQRQVLFRDADKGFNKAKMAARQLKQLNPHAQITAVEQHFSADNANELLAKADWVLDCTDNYQSRKLINQLCQQHQISLLSAAAIGQQGQLMLWPFAYNHSPCYSCLFPDLTDQSGNCSSLGVLAPLPGIIGSMQAMLLIQQIIQPDTQAKFWQFEGLGFRLSAYDMPAQSCYCRIEKTN
jgi:molybdopterin/thiamine biosynthesis adenylyltransferase